MSKKTAGPEEQYSFVYRVCELFFRDRKSVSEIAEILGSDYSRESIYPQLARAVDMLRGIALFNGRLVN